MSRRARLQWRRSPRAGDGNRPAPPLARPAPSSRHRANVRYFGHRDSNSNFLKTDFDSGQFIFGSELPRQEGNRCRSFCRTLRLALEARIRRTTF
jgi:hypothetical protein